jgi:hypothetical protein
MFVVICHLELCFSAKGKTILFLLCDEGIFKHHREIYSDESKKRWVYPVKCTLDVNVKNRIGWLRGAD